MEPRPSMLRAVVRRLRPLGSSAAYWERRYRAGGTSGEGSYGEAAVTKAEVVNAVVRTRGVRSVVELGCGDGNQLSLLDVPRYLGLDVSGRAVELCIERFAHDRTKSFLHYDPEHTADPAGFLRADLALSQEVIFHLVEDAVFERYMHLLFASAERFVLICSSDRDEPSTKHVRHRAFTRWVDQHAPGWTLVERTPATVAPLDADQFLYARAA